MPAFNPQHEMLADQLKGHIYKMSPWQYMEVCHHIDPELTYIITEVVHQFYNKLTVNNKTNFYVRELFDIVIEKVCAVLIERLELPSSIKNIILLDRVRFLMMDAREKVGEPLTTNSIIDVYLIYAVHGILLQLHPLKYAV